MKCLNKFSTEIINELNSERKAMSSLVAMIQNNARILTVITAGSVK